MPLKQLPTAATEARPFSLPAPFAEITGQRTSETPTGLVVTMLGLQSALTHVAKARLDTRSEEARTEAVQQQYDLMVRFFDTLVSLFNAVIVAYNLHEYARADGQAYGAAGQLTRDDVILMPDALRQALIGVVMQKDTSDPKDAPAS